MRRRASGGSRAHHQRFVMFLLLYYLCVTLQKANAVCDQHASIRTCATTSRANNHVPRTSSAHHKNVLALPGKCACECEHKCVYYINERVRLCFKALKVLQRSISGKSNRCTFSTLLPSPPPPTRWSCDWFSRRVLLHMQLREHIPGIHGAS